MNRAPQTPAERMAVIEAELWIGRTVAEIFRAAFRVLQAMPLSARDRPQVPSVAWPEMAYLPSEHGRDSTDPRLVPNGRQIGQADLVLAWVRDIENKRLAYLVTGRALKVPYGRLADRDGRSADHLGRLVSDECSRIAVNLNTWKVKPGDFAELRKLAD